ncbi:caspase-1-like isoform X2 [Daphnia pulicaria]|uniref:caspase-1-like isoform X2 n=1 Tax=Daphnia pulicaria TaxID=35523 RepID=UPI001EEB3897|nr:caspase-1-like isoform X2 [Daphnia pulicaria]
MNSNDEIDAQPLSTAEATINEPFTAPSQQPEIDIQSEECTDHPYIRAPVKKNSPCYNMEHKRRGDAIIFHHEKFDSNLELTPRENDKDLLNKLINVLNDLQFNVCVCEDWTYKQIEKKITKLATKEDHRNSDCILFVFMTHGYNGKLYAKDTHYNPDPLRLLFTSDKCPSLAGKPKIFIIQACRGNSPDLGTSLTPRPKHSSHRVSSSDETDGHKSEPFKMATHADFLIANSTVSNFTSYRTWFLEAFCDVLSSEKYRKDDFLSIMTTVQRKVAISFANELGDKQIPSLTTMLTRKLYFTSKKKTPQRHARMSCISSNVSE